MPAVSAETEAPAFQDLIPGNHCYGCGPGNAQGLHIRSRWTGADRARCHFRPQPYHCAGSPRYVNGGLITTLMDCHAVCTAIAYAYRQAGRDIGAGEPLHYVTAALEVSFRHPTPVESEVTVEDSTFATNTGSALVFKDKANGKSQLFQRCLFVDNTGTDAGAVKLH